MKNLIFTLLALTLSLPIFAQEEEYKSKERDDYWKDVHFKEFEPLEKQKILDFKSTNYQLVEIKDFDPYDSKRYFTPAEDSIMQQFSRQHFFSKPELIGKIDRVKILKYEKNQDKEAFIYWNGVFEDIFFGETGIWLAYKESKTTDWKYYYTGIVQKQPLYVKWYSKIPLMLENNKFQIEASLMQQTAPFSHPGPGAEYQLVKDGLAVVFDLSVISKDSDNDGLTDIVEEKLCTNPFNKDTDNDGIPDNIDLNPRFNLKRTDKTLLYEAFLNNDTPWKSFVRVPKYIKDPHKKSANDSTETILIVTDDPELQAVEPTKQRVIFMTDKEYEQSKGLFKTGLNRMTLGPLFKVDNKKNTYIISTSINTGGEEYLIIRTKNGWKIKQYSSWIS